MDFAAAPFCVILFEKISRRRRYSTMADQICMGILAHV